MFAKLRMRFGTAGLVLSIVAVVFALAGGAFAASGALSGKQKKEVETIAKKYAGKPGATGPAGPAGPAGASGKEGASGAPGAVGTSVTSAAVAAGGAACEGHGGSEFKTGTTTTYACNGEKGPRGAEGNIKATLSPEQSESGVWSAGEFHSEGETQAVPISFPIPLASPPVVHFINDFEGENEFCPGSLFEPKATPGNLCVYTASFNSTTVHWAEEGKGAFFKGARNENGAGVEGTLMTVHATKEGSTVVVAHDQGTWAVTAPAE
jgi:hypothetical protein